MSISDSTLLEQLFEYYRWLQSRRWQYFATLAVADIGLLNVWREVGEEKPDVLSVETFIAVSFFVLLLAILRLMSRIRARINWVAIQINRLAPMKMVKEGKPKTYGFGGVTIWLYVAFVLLLLPWMFLVFSIKPIVCYAMVVLFVFVLIIGVDFRLPEFEEQDFYTPMRGDSSGE